MSFLELAKKRCSCRNFNDQQVPEETLQYILEAGRVAPTGVNKQPQHHPPTKKEKTKGKEDKQNNYHNNTKIVISSLKPKQ